jgi:hypothetical protein
MNLGPVTGSYVFGSSVHLDILMQILNSVATVTFKEFTFLYQPPK